MLTWPFGMKIYFDMYVWEKGKIKKKQKKKKIPNFLWYGAALLLFLFIFIFFCIIQKEKKN